MVSVFVAALALSQGKEPTLLALTPMVDGNIAAEEWLPLADDRGIRTFFQWEPGAYDFAATLPVGEDLVVSLDMDGDGWLAGEDNREIRVRWSGGKATATVRSLTVAGRQGPAFSSATLKTLALIGSESGGTWTVEASLRTESERAREGRIVGVTMDSVPSGGDTGPAYLPRSLSYLKLGFDAAVGAPDGLAWRSETKLREVAREDELNLKFVLSGAGDYTTAAFRCEGWGQNDLTTETKEFMGFNRDGRASFEYSSRIAEEAPAGWRIVRATLNGPSGEVALRTSVKIADLIEFDLTLPERLEYTAEARTVKGSLTVRSTGIGRVNGRYDVALDPTWTAKKGGAQRILIYNPRGRERINLEFVVPAGSAGEFPVTFTVLVGGKTYTKSAVVTITPPGR